MNWDDLRFVLEVARTGGIVAASKTLRVAHTTVARRLAALEQAHGAKIFERRGNTYHPTLVGRAMVELATEMHERIGTLERQLDAREPRIEGEVRIATVAVVAERLGAQVIAFRERYPDVRLRLSVSNDMVSLSKGEADVAIRITVAPPERLVGRKLTDARFAVYGAQGTLPESEPDLSELSWVCLDASRAHTPQGRWEASHVPPERVVLRTNSRGLILDTVRRGMGVAVLPMGLGDGLVPVTPPLDDLTLPIWILTHEDLRKTPRIRAVMDFFAEAIAVVQDDL